MTNQIILGDCFEVLEKIPNNSINLILTNPPLPNIKRIKFY
jgi:DNA modification methylase